jgi:hypothetical protein
MRNPKHVIHVYTNSVAFALPDSETCRLIFRNSNDEDDEDDEVLFTTNHWGGRSLHASAHDPRCV